MMYGHFACLCCGNLTLCEPPPGSYDICPVCNWEDDYDQGKHPDSSWGANSVSLNEARKKYKLIGATDERFLKDVRPPKPEELPSENEETPLPVKDPSWICICCGYLTLSAPSPGTNEVCFVCGWKDDEGQTKDPRSNEGLNPVCLLEAKNNFKQFGACSQESRGNVRSAWPNEIPPGMKDGEWKLVGPP